MRLGNRRSATRHGQQVELARPPMLACARRLTCSCPRRQRASLGHAGHPHARKKRRSGDAAGGKGDKPPNAHRGETLGCANTYKDGGNENIRVNQDCSLRRQAEAVVAINPIDPDNLIAGQNDSRLGFNKCGYAFTFDGGKTWGDMVPPFYQFVNSDVTTFDACSDPTATFDADGNAYVGGVLFMVGPYADSAFVVAKSNAEIGGAFYHTPAPLPFQEYRDVPLGVVANDNNPD